MKRSGITFGRMAVYSVANGNPILGRMLSPDNYVQAPTYTQSYNRYSYVWNNPLKYTDPSGDYVAYNANYVFNPQGYYNNSSYGLSMGESGSSKVRGGGGGVGPGIGQNGGGLGGVYYDWYSGEYRRTENGAAMPWSAASEIILPYSAFLQGGVNIGSIKFGKKNGADGVWFQTVNVTGYDNRTADGILAYVGVVNTFVASNNSSSSKAGFDIDLAVAHLNSNANQESVYQCSKYVQNALVAGGIKAAINQPVQRGGAYGPLLKNWGFQNVNVINYDPLKGDIVVMQGYPGGTLCGSCACPCGHIQMYNGSQWVSDFFQSRPFWPGQKYEENKPSFEIFRWY